eukprot:6180322-Pleurochrysis_carterae.AAC.3
MSCKILSTLPVASSPTARCRHDGNGAARFLYSTWEAPPHRSPMPNRMQPLLPDRTQPYLPPETSIMEAEKHDRAEDPIGAIEPALAKAIQRTLDKARDVASVYA